MKYVLQCDFPYAGPWGEEMNRVMESLAKSINDEPGFIWKIWTVNEAKKEAGGIYVFNSEENACAYLKKHELRLLSAGIPHVTGKIFAVNEFLSGINGAPV